MVEKKTPARWEKTARVVESEKIEISLSRQEESCQAEPVHRANDNEYDQVKDFPRLLRNRHIVERIDREQDRQEYNQNN